MSKSYIEDLSEWVDKRPKKKKRQQDAATVAFLAVRVDVKAALDAGYAMTTIWEHMHVTGKLKCSYETFRNHVQRYIKQVQPSSKQNDNKASQYNGVEKPSDSQMPKNTETAISGFTFHPKPNKEDLL